MQTMATPIVTTPSMMKSLEVNFRQSMNKPINMNGLTIATHACHACHPAWRKWQLRSVLQRTLQRCFLHLISKRTSYLQLPCRLRNSNCRRLIRYVPAYKMDTRVAISLRV
jgi:hypothetical protein